MKLTLETRWSAVQIDQALYMNLHEEARDELMRQVIDLQDAHIRAALIDLGWTPPKATPA